MPVPIFGAIGAIGISPILGALSDVFNSPMARIFANTLKDISGVIGQMLIPVFRIFNTVARGIGDVLATVTPIVMGLFLKIEEAFTRAKPIFDAMGDVFIMLVDVGESLAESVGNVIGDILKSISELLGSGNPIKDFAQVIRWLGITIVGTAVTIKNIAQELWKIATLQWSKVRNPVDMFRDIQREVEAAVGKSKETRKSSVGMGAQTASYTDLESYEKKIREAAFSMGFGLSGEPARVQREQRQLTAIELIAQNTDPRHIKHGQGFGGADTRQWERQEGGGTPPPNNAPGQGELPQFSVRHGRFIDNIQLGQ